MLRALNRAAVPGFASTSGFPMRTFPASSFASIAIVGAIIRHGPHHAAHISSRTGKCDPSTTDAKFASVTLTGSEDGAGRAALHFPQTGCFSRAAPNRTRFFAPQFGHGTTKLFAGTAMILFYCAGPGAEGSLKYKIFSFSRRQTFSRCRCSTRILPTDSRSVNLPLSFV